MKHLIIHSTLVLAMVISGCGDSNEQGTPGDAVMREIDRVGFGNLSDTALFELYKSKELRKKVITAKLYSDAADSLKEGGHLGSNFDEIALTIFNKVETLPTINTQVRNKVITYYSQKLDKLSYLDSADLIKDALVKDFTSDFDSIFSNKILKAEIK